jgi:hypothetical protein
VRAKKTLPTMTEIFKKLLYIIDITSLYSLESIDKEQVNLYLGCLLDEWQDINLFIQLKIEYWKIEKNFNQIFKILEKDDFIYWLEILGKVRPEIIRYIDKNYTSKSEIIFDYDSKNISIEYDYSTPQEREHMQILSHVIKLNDQMDKYFETNF